MPPRKKRALELKPGDDVSAVAQTVQKKENGRRNVRGKRGGLKDMLSMPLDVLMEVFRQYPHLVISYSPLGLDPLSFGAARSAQPCSHFETLSRFAHDPEVG